MKGFSGILKDACRKMAPGSHKPEDHPPLTTARMAGVVLIYT